MCRTRMGCVWPRSSVLGLAEIEVLGKCAEALGTMWKFGKRRRDFERNLSAWEKTWEFQLGRGHCWREWYLKKRNGGWERMRMDPDENGILRSDFGRLVKAFGLRPLLWTSWLHILDRSKDRLTTFSLYRIWTRIKSFHIIHLRDTDSYYRTNMHYRVLCSRSCVSLSSLNRPRSFYVSHYHKGHTVTASDTPHSSL